MSHLRMMAHHAVTPPPAPSAEAAAAPAVRAAVARAREAWPAWAARPAAERATVIRRFHDAMYRRRHELAGIITRENGKPLTDALVADVLVSLEFATWIARRVPRFQRARWRGVEGLLFLRKRVRIERRPVGVLGVITPWNYPLFMPASTAMAALACGNAVVLKPSEFTPESAAALEGLFREAGLPEGVLQVVQGDGAAGAALVRAGVDKVCFTGSVATGRRIAIACAEQLLPCALELGGSDAAIVLADADVRHAADGITWTRFANAGQTCVAPKRIYVEAPAYDAFVAAVSRAVTALRVGHGEDPATEVGRMIHGQAVTQLSAQRDDALAHGARVAATAPLPAEGTRGAFFPPTVLVDVDDSMRVLREETFGPLLPIVKVRDADEAVARANASPFGLSASVWTRDRARGLRVAQRLEAGTVMLNDATAVVGMPGVPYGGVKESGIGRMHGEAGLEEFVRATPIVDDRVATWHQPWWFRYGPAHFAGLEAYGRLAHGATWGERLRGIPGVLRLLIARKGTA